MMVGSNGKTHSDSALPRDGIGDYMLVQARTEETTGAAWPESARGG